MRRAVITLLLVFSLAAPAYAVSIYDTIMCKKVILKCGRRKVLVDRLTGEVKYGMQGDNSPWVKVDGAWKRQLQAMYDAESAPEPY